jgi:hypothetical protein
MCEEALCARTCVCVYVCVYVFVCNCLLCVRIVIVGWAGQLTVLCVQLFDEDDNGEVNASDLVVGLQHMCSGGDGALRGARACVV